MPAVGAALVPDGLIFYGLAHKVIKGGQSTEDEQNLENAAERVVQLKPTAQGPTGGPSGADDFRPHQNRHTRERQQIGPVDCFVGCHVRLRTLLRKVSNYTIAQRRATEAGFGGGLRRFGGQTLVAS
jgi:hypothetical protein